MLCGEYMTTCLVAAIVTGVEVHIDWYGCSRRKSQTRHVLRVYVYYLFSFVGMVTPFSFVGRLSIHILGICVGCCVLHVNGGSSREGSLVVSKVACVNGG